MPIDIGPKESLTYWRLTAMAERGKAKPRINCEGCAWLYFEEPDACADCFEVDEQNPDAVRKHWRDGKLNPVEADSDG